MTSVLIADDQQLQRLAFRVLLEGEPGLTVSGEAGRAAPRRSGWRPTCGPTSW